MPVLGLALLGGGLHTHTARGYACYTPDRYLQQR